MVYYGCVGNESVGVRFGKGRTQRHRNLLHWRVILSMRFWDRTWQLPVEAGSHRVVISPNHSLLR